MHTVNAALETALERQDLSRTYLAHHELESEFIIIIIICMQSEDCDDDPVGGNGPGQGSPAGSPRLPCHHSHCLQGL